MYLIIDEDIGFGKAAKLSDITHSLSSRHLISLGKRERNHRMNSCRRDRITLPQPNGMVDNWNWVDFPKQMQTGEYNEH